MPRRLVYVVNEAAFFVRHRLGHVAEAVAAGYDVHVAVPPGPGDETITALGGVLHPLPLSRGRAGPRREGATIAALGRLYWRLRPQLVHHISVKPVLYGTVAARLMGVPAVVNTIPGLGWLFTGEGSAAAVRRRTAIAVYRLALRHPRMRIIVQNPDDRDELVRARIAAADRIVHLDGAGVDLNEFRMVPPPEGVPLVVLPARMLRDKGVVEFVEAARLLRDRVRARFALVGGIDRHNPAGLSTDTLREWQADGLIEWWGHRDDMPAVLSQASIVVLPSYREGMPRTLLEAAASGRPIVTTDVPGCRQAVVPNETGFLVPARDVPALAAAIARLLDDCDLRRRMGAAARLVAVRRWNIDHIVTATLDVYRELLSA